MNTSPSQPSPLQPASQQGLHPETVAIQAGRSANGTSLSTPIWASAVWRTPTIEHARKAASGTRSAEFYSRYANPTVSAFEQAVAAMEGAESAMAFGSGMGAIATVVFAFCSPGDHIVAQRQIYSGTQLFLQGPVARMGIDVTWVDGSEPGAFAAAVRPGKTMMVLAETPANPQLSLVDLAELGAIRGPITVVDSTFGTPALQQPLRYGVTLSLHSATKGISGHNDVTLGVVAGAKDYLDDIWTYAVLHGATASPYDAHAALRGVRTMPVRLARQSATALSIAEFLAAHPAVATVNYPFLDSHPQVELARRQMSAGGGMLSFDLIGGFEASRSFLESIEVILMATSLGGPDTIVSCPAQSTHVGLSREELVDAGITPGLVRMSVGLEHPDDLIADLDRALSKATRHG